MKNITALKFSFALVVGFSVSLAAAAAIAQVPTPEHIMRLPSNYDASRPISEHAEPVVDNSINHGIVDNSAADSGIYKFTSGGVGEEGRDGFLAQNAGQGYTLRLTFTGPTGGYVALVNVSILDNKGEEVVRTQTDGPIMLAALPAGTYTVKADLEGEAKSQRVTIAKSGQRMLTIRFSTGD